MNSHDKIIENDLAIADSFLTLEQYHREIASLYNSMAGLIKSNCQLRQDLTSSEKTFSASSTQELKVPDISQGTYSPPLSENEQTPFQQIQSLFPNVTVSHITDKRDDSFVRTIMGRIAVQLDNVICPVIEKERRVYQTLDGDCVLFRLSTWNPQYKPNSVGFSVNQQEFNLFNLSNYLLIARFKQASSHTDGFEDWAIYDISQLRLDIASDGTVEYRQQANSQVLRIEPIDKSVENPFFYLRLNLPERLIEPILQG